MTPKKTNRQVRGREVKEPIYELLEHLYFVEGLEELPFLEGMKGKYVDEWARTRGRRFKNIFWALILEQNPAYILNQLLEEDSLPKSNK